MGYARNYDTGLEEFFVGSKKILSVDIKTHEITYHHLPVKLITVYEIKTADGSESHGFFSNFREAEGAQYNGLIVDQYEAIQITNGSHVKTYLLLSNKPIDVDNQQRKNDEVLRQQTIDSLSDEQLRVLGISRSQIL